MRRKFVRYSPAGRWKREFHSRSLVAEMFAFGQAQHAWRGMEFPNHFPGGDYRAGLRISRQIPPERGQCGMPPS